MELQSGGSPGKDGVIRESIIKLQQIFARKICHGFASERVFGFLSARSVSFFFTF